MATCDEVMRGYMGGIFGGYEGVMRDGPPPRNRAVGSAVFWTAPQSTKGGEMGRQTTSDPKKECLFLV